MSKFTQRHYEAIAKILGIAKAEEATIKWFIHFLELDNPKFKPHLFIKAIEKAETDYYQ